MVDLIKHHGVRSIAAFLGLLFLMLFAAPSGVPVLFYAVPFVLIFLTFYNGLVYFVDKVADVNSGGRSIIFVASVIVVVVVALKSIGQLTVRDILTLGLILLLGYFYVHRNFRKS